MSTSQQCTVTEVEEDGDRMATPIAASHQSSLLLDHNLGDSSASAGEEDNDEMRNFSASIASMLDHSLNLADVGTTDSNETHPTPPTRPTNGHIVLPLLPSSSRSQPAHVLPGSHIEDAIADLPPDIASADLAIPADYNFVETSSGPAARIIKQRLDHHAGVGKDVRSPYTITAFVNMYGKQMYRVGYRLDAPPGASIVDDVDVRSTRAKSTSVESTASTSPSAAPAHPQGKRPPRMSVHSFLPPAMFAKNGTANAPPKSPTQEGSRSPPVRKLRKTRSIPNLFSPTPEPTTSQPAPTAIPATGRPHAHSVSSVDAFRPPVTSINTSAPPPSHDIFSDVMSWNSVPPSPLSSDSQLRSTRSFHTPSERPCDHQMGEPILDIIRHPFGKGVLFDAPSWHSPSHLSSPPVIREMQSFESGLTARADPSPRTIRTGKLRATRHSDDSMQIPEEEPLSQPDTPVIDPPKFEPLAEDTMLTRYPTDLFDVLQNYKGLPVIDSIAADPNQTTIRLSLQTEETAAPKDDPRFVIWGEVDAGNASPSRSTTDVSSSHSVASRRKSTRDWSEASMPSVQVPSGEPTKKVLVAATIERWIAQLTSELNYDELLIFFLTYRTYISALDLGHLLICRFHWALAQASSSRDETVRRIVRVRTFIAIRYWLLTFFNTDFVPNPELRALFADWLNTLRKDTILARHKDAMSIVLKLRKVVRDCKEAYTQSAKGEAQPKTKPKPKPVVPQPSALGDLSNGNFAEALRIAVDGEDPDVDLNLDGVDVDRLDSAVSEFRLSTVSPSLNPSTSVDLHLLRQPLHLAFLQYGKQSAPTPPSQQMVSNQAQLPVQHSAISRVVVNAIGRLGRWKRVLNYRTAGTRAPLRPPLGFGAACVDATTFDVEASETGDLLMVRGGVEQYLKTIETQILARKAAGMYRPQKALDSPPSYDIAISHPSFASSITSTINPELSEPATATRDEPIPTEGDPTAATPKPPNTTPASIASSDISVPASPPASSSPPSARSFARDDIRSVNSSSSYARRPRYQMDVVSIDDLDLSDLSSTEDLNAAPATGLRREPRRLPARRDFEFVRRSMDSVSSMGIRTHDSVLSAGSSVISSTHVSGNGDMAGPIHQWQMNALVDSLSDDEESGDVEAALRRLEGQINEDKQRAKQSKVDGWVQSIRERLANGQFGSDRRRYSSDEEDYGEVQSRLRENEDGSEAAASQSQGSRSRTSVSQISSRNSVSSAYSPFSVAPPAEETRAPAVPPGLGHPLSHGDGKPAPEDAVPLEILQSRVPSRPTTSAGSPPSEVPPPLPTNRLSLTSGPGNGFAKPERSLRRHRSFVLAYKSDVIVQHFSMIDRDLFLNLKFDELVSQHFWMTPSDEYNILDWSQFTRDLKSKAEGGGTVKTSALTAIRCRFNLIANFVIAEIVITHPSERLMVLSKFIRIAWKAYIYKSFNTLVAVLSAVASQWVTRAMQQSNAKLGIWETRMLRDLQQWATSAGDFKHIRQATEALEECRTKNVASPDGSTMGAEAQGPTSRSRAASEGKPPVAVGCVPFFGVYLSELHRYSRLPDLVDPTAPHEPIDIDPETNIFESPAHPEVFSNLVPLPPSVQLEALINVHKQRLVAGVVKSLVSGQHLAAKVQYPVEKKLFQKCLRLRGLNAETLQRAMDLYSKRDA